MQVTPKPGDRVTWWWTADNCRCPANGHQDPDVDRHPMADGRTEPVLTECRSRSVDGRQAPILHHRTLTGYAAKVLAVHQERDRRQGIVREDGSIETTTIPGRVICDLEVEMPVHIGPGSRHNLVTRQEHSVLADGRRPRSGECTPGTLEEEIVRHTARSS